MTTIHEILNIPKYYTNVSMNINSDRIKQVLETDLINNLRKLYQNDIKLFYNIRDELILRGIGFHSSFKSSHLLGLPYEIENIIQKEEDTKGFEQVEFGLMGANNFIERFNIQSDLFFNGVPLEGLHYFTVGISIKMLKNMVEKAGFSVIPVEEFEFNNYSLKQRSSAGQLAEKSIGIHAPCMELSIGSLFSGDDLRSFRQYCHKNKIYKFNELTLDFIEQFEHEKKIRGKSISKTMDIFNQINKQFYYLFTRIDILIEKLQKNSFKQFLEEFDIDYLGFLNEFYESESKNKKEDNYPFEKVENIIIEKLSHLEDGKFKQLILSIKEHSYFEYIENLTLLKIKNMIAPTLEIEGIEEVTLIECFNDIQYEELLKSLLNELDKVPEISGVFENILAQLTDRELEVLELRQTKTLQEVGEYLGVTRERVRQIQKKALRILFEKEKLTYLDFYIYHYTNERSQIITVDNFMNYYTLDESTYAKLLHIIFDNKKTIKYIKELNVYVGSEEYEFVNDILQEVGIGDPIIKVDDIKRYFEEDTLETHINFIDLFLKSQKYIRVDSIYVKEKITIIARVNYLFENVITEPLEMNDEGL